MSIDDRDWYRHDRQRRAELVWNEKSGELESDRAQLGLRLEALPVSLAAKPPREWPRGYVPVEYATDGRPENCAKLLF